MNSPVIVAMTATHDRPHLLLNRCLPSIVSQSHPADQIVVINDRVEQCLGDRIADLVPGVDYLKNRRTKGLSGALNTGLDHLARTFPRPSDVFVAFLDDDDAWMRDHLAAVVRRIASGGELVATPFLRIETGQEPRRVDPPRVLTPEMFMVGNPGIQGSNLIARLDILLEAGGFNEALPSCTDRDLMIRLCRRHGLNYATTELPSVKYHAASDLERLSRPGAVAKMSGLDMFDHIHGPLMSEAVRSAHHERAERLFCWHPRQCADEVDRATPAPPPSEAETPPLLIGMIVDDRRIASASRLLADLAGLVEAEGLETPDILLLENRASDVPGEAMSAMVMHHRSKLRIRVVDHIAMTQLIRSGGFNEDVFGHDGRVSIADARTVLQSCLYHASRERPGCVVWILDDDMRLDPLFLSQAGSERIRLPLGKALRRMRATGADICIGPYTGAPPLPAVASVRGQLVDLMWNLRRLSDLPGNAPVPASEPHNSRLRRARRDYYHDLSRIETDRLETPFALEPSREVETCSEALKRLARMIPRILAGEAPLRPLVQDRWELDRFSTNTVFQRGGNTFVFNHEALADLPNAAPSIAGRSTRRSDMIWSVLQARRCGRRVLSVPVPVRHDRSDLPCPESLDIAGIADDIRGFAIANAMKDGWGNADRIASLCAKFEQERLAALNLSFHRVRGVARELMAWCQTDLLWPAEVAETLFEQAEKLLSHFAESSLRKIEKAVRELGPTQVRDFLDGLEDRVASHAKWVRSAPELSRLLEDERVAAARGVISKAAGPGASVRLLGYGAEGVVFTDGQTSWKLFDRWTSVQAEKAVPVLKGLIAGECRGETLIRPSALTHTELGWLLAAPYEPSDPWPGGNGPGLVELIASLHRSKIACRNLHPKNLRVAGDKVRLIDYGADIVPLDDPKAESLEFKRMCRRAWLCWRWWWREDLDNLMQQSLANPHLPEMCGHEHFIHAVRERLGLRDLPDPTLERAQELRPKRVLDYGAGKGKQAVVLAQAGAEVVAWDPDPSLAPRLNSLAGDGVQAAATVEAALAGGPFDLVICRRVACLLNDAELNSVLGDLRRAVRPEGRVLLALCHPAYAHRVRVAEADVVCYPTGSCPSTWKKRVRSTGRILKEVHRTERVLRRLIRRAGLRIVGRSERLCTEFERFETVADLLLLELVPAPLPEVSFLVKACAMDAEALEVQVRDMLAALEDPSVFCETVLTLDTRISGFPRAHAGGDLQALRAAAKRLLAAGDVDRIVESPSDPKALRALNKRWFGLDLAVAHSEGGAAIGALLTGFEACTAPRILHADLDMMIGRIDRTHDPVAELLSVLDGNPNAVTASFPVARDTPRPWTTGDVNGPWRVESRLGIVDMHRMARMLPLPNEDAGGFPRLSWHRALDRAIRDGHGASLRGGGGQAFCLHPQNFRKADIDAWEDVRVSVARGFAPVIQNEQIEWTGTLSDWRRPERSEPFVFVICGRNVMPERFRRCWNSVLSQRHEDWGAIVIDDASSPWISEEIFNILAPQASKVSFIARRRRAGLMANTVAAVRNLCASPEQVILTLDADDHLVGDAVLTRLAREYERGADLTVGSMLRTDKSARYPVQFDNPRSHRGGNVWQHLRSFRKALFDALPEESLKLDGSYVDLASDWALMLPLVEIAEQPVWIREPLYLHEPGDERDPARAERREAVIAQLVAKDKLNRINLR